MSPPALVAVLAPLALLPAAYAVWWLDRFRLSLLPRFVAVLALATAAGGLLAAFWPAAPAGSMQLAGPAMPSADAAVAAVALAAAPSARLVAAALAVLLFMLVRGEVETPLDGVLYGVACGVGLALPVGWVQAEAGAAGGAALVAAALVPVGVAGVVGLAVAWARLDLRWLPRATIVLAGTAAALVVAVGAAALAAAADRPWPAAVAGVVALATALALALVVEVRIGSRELAEETALGVLPAWASELAPRYWRRVASRWWPRRDERRAVSRLLLDLAYRKHQLRHLGDQRAALYSLEVGRLRERARALLVPRPAAGDGAAGGHDG